MSHIHSYKSVIFVQRKRFESCLQIFLRSSNERIQTRYYGFVKWENVTK
jgi:hypothetical protein